MKKKIYFLLMIPFLLFSLVSCTKNYDFTIDVPAEITVGQSVVLKSSTKVLWSVDNQTLASIDGDTLTALKEGTVVLTAKNAKKESKQLTANILIKKKTNTVYEITYQLDGGTLPENAPLTYEETVGLDTLPIPTKENYKFIGWYLNSEKVNIISTTQTGDIILVAVYEREGQNYNITYELDGGTLPENAPTTYTESIGLEELPIPTKENYKFIGWYLNSEKVNIISTTQTGDIILVAVYEREGQNYNITYELDGGTLPENAPTTYIETIGIEELPIPTKENYEFAGWYLSTISMAQYTSIDSTSKGDIKFIARWTPLINENEIVLPEAPYHFTKIKKVEHSSGNGTYVYQPDFQGVGVSSTSVLQYDWHSSNESVATISIYSSITARSAGFAIITAVSKTDSNIIINCII
ncbi:MAG TPA: InlB B-repeat-containing protein, partial [Bacilli bacterium]|nr:InlB B-repeat-containing protein [Bacilli bacterium]